MNKHASFVSTDGVDLGAVAINADGTYAIKNMATSISVDDDDASIINNTETTLDTVGVEPYINPPHTYPS